MKNVLLAIMISIGVLVINLAQAETNEKVLQLHLKDLDSTTISRTIDQNKKFRFILKDILTPEEKGYKNNVIMFMVDDKPYMYTFNLYTKLSNDGIEQTAILFVPKGLLVRIAESNKTVLKIGGNRNTEIGVESKDRLKNMLFKES